MRAAGVLAAVAVAALAMIRSNVFHGAQREGGHSRRPLPCCRRRAPILWGRAAGGPRGRRVSISSMLGRRPMSVPTETRSAMLRPSTGPLAGVSRLYHLICCSNAAAIMHSCPLRDNRGTSDCAQGPVARGLQTGVDWGSGRAHYKSRFQEHNNQSLLACSAGLHVTGATTRSPRMQLRHEQQLCATRAFLKSAATGQSTVWHFRSAVQS